MQKKVKLSFNYQSSNKYLISSSVIITTYFFFSGCPNLSMQNSLKSLDLGSDSM